MKTFLIFYILLHFIIPSISFAGQAEDCAQATHLVIQAYDMGQSPAAYPKQKQLLHKALQLCPQHPEAHNNLASVLEEQKIFGQALYHYKQALNTRPDFPEAWFGIGEVYYKTGKFPWPLSHT